MEQVIVGIIIICFAILLLLLIYRLISLKRSYGQKEKLLVDYFSNFYGVSSKGIKQIRGNGILFLSSDSLNFEMYIPRRKYTISINMITEISKANEHLGKMGVSLLRIKFKEGSHYEEAAWAVNHVQKWINELSILREKQIVSLK